MDDIAKNIVKGSKVKLGVRSGIKDPSKVGGF